MSDRSQVQSESPNVVLLRVITNTNGTFEFAVELDGTIGETRALLGAQMVADGDASRIKMTFRGVVLEKDDALWATLAPRRGESMYAVVVAAKAVAPSNIPLGMGSSSNTNGVLSHSPSAASSSSASSSAMSQQAKMMEPMIDSLVSSPGFVDTIIAMSPELKGMIEKNPEMREQLNNPELMKLMMRSQYDPLARQEMDRAMNSQMAHINNIPGGMAMLERMMGNVLGEERYAPKTEADKKMATEENAKPKEGQSANNLEAPNPWARPNNSNNSANNYGAAASPFGRFGMGGGMPNAMAGAHGGMMNPFMGMGGGGGMGMGANPNTNWMASLMGMGGGGIGVPPRPPPQWGGAAANGANNNTNNNLMMNPFMQAMLLGGGGGIPTRPNASSAPSVAAGANSNTVSAPPTPASLSSSSPPPSSHPPPRPSLPSSSSHPFPYAEQLALLKDMGFEDEGLMRRTLEASKGDVDAAVAFIDAAQQQQEEEEEEE